jgi:hypothetical protein
MHGRLRMNDGADLLDRGAFGSAGSGLRGLNHMLSTDVALFAAIRQFVIAIL